MHTVYDFAGACLHASLPVLQIVEKRTSVHVPVARVPVSGKKLISSSLYRERERERERERDEIAAD
jgi:hypothetical protein